MLKYSPEIITTLIEALGDNKESFNWLMENKYPELGAFCNSLKGDYDAYDWLIKYKFNHLAAFADAIYDEFDAFLWLKKYNYTELAIIVLATRDDKKAINWLKEKNMLSFQLAEKIKQVKDERISESESFFGYLKKIVNPFRR